MTQAIVKAGDAALEPGEWQALRESAKAVVNSGFLPKAINTPEKAVTLMLAGRELGLGPMQAIRSLHVIDGKPVMSADLMAGLVHKKIRGAMLRIVESTNEACTIDAGRPDQEPTRFTFTLDDAKAAGLLGKDNWRKYPRAMLRARCLAEAVRAVFPDVLLGVYDPDELGAVTSESGEIVAYPVDDVQDGDGHSLIDNIRACDNANSLATLKAAAKHVWKASSPAKRDAIKDAIYEAEERISMAAQDEPEEVES